MLLSLISCNNKIQLNDNCYTSYDGVYLTISSFDKENKAYLLNAVWHNETNYSVIYGNEYTIKYNDNGKWKDIANSDIEFTEIAHTLEPNSTNEKTYTTEFFNMSKKGTYALFATFYIHLEEGVEQGNTYTELEIK